MAPIVIGRTIYFQRMAVIRVNAVAPGTVDTPLQRKRPKDFLKALSPMGIILNVQEIVDAVIYLAEAPHVTGEVLYVDGGNDDDHSPDQFLDVEVTATQDITLSCADLEITRRDLNLVLSPDAPRGEKIEASPARPPPPPSLNRFQEGEPRALMRSPSRSALP